MSSAFNLKGLVQGHDKQLRVVYMVPMRLTCPDCGTLHIDEGEFAKKPHHTHSCQNCGLTWRPAVVYTVGVKFLPGFKNAQGVIKMLMLVLLLAITCTHADVLIGDNPCLWKKPITANVYHHKPGHDTGWIDEQYNRCFYKTKRCKTAIMLPRGEWRTDTTGWETYWDKCPAKGEGQTQ